MLENEWTINLGAGFIVMIVEVLLVISLIPVITSILRNRSNRSSRNRLFMGAGNLATSLDAFAHQLIERLEAIKLDTNLGYQPELQSAFETLREYENRFTRGLSVYAATISYKQLYAMQMVHDRLSSLLNIIQAMKDLDLTADFVAERFINTLYSIHLILSKRTTDFSVVKSVDNGIENGVISFRSIGRRKLQANFGDFETAREKRLSELTGVLTHIYHLNTQEFVTSGQSPENSDRYPEFTFSEQP